MSDVLRWMCDQYRAALQESDPVACDRIDRVMEDAGQGWITNSAVIDPGQLLTSHQIQELHGVPEYQVRDFARRYGIPVRGKSGRANLYRLGDILAARSRRTV